MEDDSDSDAVSRRKALQIGSALGVTSVAGCLDMLNGGGESAEIPELSTFRGSGALAEGRPAPGGTSIEELPDLSGELSLYIGGGEGGIYYEFVNMLQEIYPDFEVYPNDDSSASLAQTIVEEVDSGAAQADVFWSIDASSLGFVADNDAYEPLSDEAVEAVGNAQFVGDDNAWAGVAGRARAVPYNTEELSESDIPNTVQDFPGTEALQGTMGWAPTYGAFKSFVTAMRLIQDEDATRQWLVDMREAGTERYGNEYAVSQNVASGSLAAGFANHYYAMRVKNQQPDAPIDLAFTEGDAGALINVAGALKVQGTQRGELVDNFVRHLLSAEAQEYFTTVSFAYPMIEGVEPVGGLPTVDELSPPDIDLAELSDLEPTLELMEDAGVSG
ncbi:extracellular solute-binding protein [Halopiger xanaduensis]|uniref:Extracellular solute-binding protein family 1 n=1 Tax=Halopiger xanaduensis (strain DSM 18323 / JCM 14033 / SH-6) TaxID=797210 RepID=F8D7A2_HALXS|nr:extracellular solute-binding protein [Halopiger xanaduensis]AEH36671.1 extracellular solute-binding protein family 1 [Halopiger xanaduensis SH-6]